MTLTDNRKKGIHWPMWQQTLAAEIASTAISGTCAPDIGDTSPVSDGDRYLYYFVSTGFYKFDTYENAWVRLSLPNIVAATGCALRYAVYAGHRGRVLSATASTVNLASMDGQLFNGTRIRIIGGTGKGQERMLVGPTSIVSNSRAEGRATTGSATAVTDAILKMQINEHTGRQVALTHGAGNPDIRTVLYNDATTLTVSDPLYQQIFPFENQAWSAISPHAIPVSVASGVGTHFTVEDNTFLVYDIAGGAPQDWVTTPDSTSRFVLLTGGIWLLSSLATPFFSLQFYDVLTDTWLTKTTPTGLMLAAATEWNLERCGEAAGDLDSGTADADSTTRVLNCDAGAGRGWTTDCWSNFEVRILGGTGIGQRRRVIGNTTAALTVDKKFDTAPDASSTFKIYGWAAKLWARFGGSSGLFEYDQEADLWAAQHISDFGIATNMAVWMTDHQPIGVASAVRATTGITSVNATPTAPGSGYVRGDILTCSATGSNGQVYVNRVSATGGVEEIILVRCGSGYVSTGTGKSTSGGTGTLCTIEITGVGTVGRVTTTGINHYYKRGDVVNFGGASEAAWNTSYTILAVTSLTTFDVAITATVTAAATASQSTTVVVDASKNWDVNEHRGKYVSTQGSGLTGTLAIRRIDSNTATALTLAAADALAGALTHATGRYAILDTNPIGREVLYKEDAKDGIGYATSGGTTTLTDSTKNWVVGQWVGCKFRITAGTGFDSSGNEVTITSNDKNTLTYSAPGFTPDATSRYMIYDTFGKCTSAGSTTVLNDSAKLWPTNGLVGKRVRIVAGAGFGNEMTILTNTATQLTWTAVTGLAPDATTEYVVYGPQALGVGGQMLWPYGNSVETIKSHYIVGLRGASNAADAYDVNKDRWDVSVLTVPLNDVFGAGTMMAYDGEDGIYIHVNNTGRIYKFDMTSFKYEGAGQMPMAHGTAIAGGRMEIISTADGAKILYIMQNSGAIMFRKVLR
jgi:hypothetical protein